MKIILALVFLSNATLAAAQSPPVLFSKVEKTIAQKEPAWTMMDQYKGQGPRVAAAIYRWRLEQCEVGAWIVVEPSIEAMIVNFQNDGFRPTKIPSQKLNFGDESYMRQTDRHTSIVIRKGLVLVRLGCDCAGPVALSRFAAHISQVLDELSTSKTKKEEALSKVEAGETALKNRQYNEAIEQFKKALEIDPESSSAYRGLGLAHLKAGDKQKASEAFKEALRLNPDSAQAHYDLGSTYYETGEDTSAASSFEEAIHLKPDFSEALIALGKTYQRSGLHAKSVGVLRKAVLQLPQNTDANMLLGSALILAGKPGEAIEVFRDVVRLSPESALAYANLAHAYQQTGKFEQAFDALQQALRISPDDPLTHN
jgi:tetratricopeptide (TPR) repeat protein